MAGATTRVVTIRRDGLVSTVRQSAPTDLRGPAVHRARWQCAVCGKLLSSKRSYDEHLNIHNRSRPFSCEHCDYAAASQMTLRRHILRNHTSRDDWGYKCPYCGDSYMEPASYQQHVSSRHFGRSATFGCPYSACSFQSKGSRHFREHLTKHHNCLTEARRVGGATTAYHISDDNLQHYLVDDDLGGGWGRRATAVARPVIRSNGDLATVLTTATSTVLKEKRERNGENDIKETSIPSTSSSPLLPLPPISSIPRSVRLIKKDETMESTMEKKEEEDYMKAPISLNRVVNTTKRIVPRNAPNLHANERKPLTDDRKPVSGQPESTVIPPRSTERETTVLLGGAVEAPPMLSGDADWIEHEEVVGSTTVYPDGSVDFPCD